MSDRVSDGKVDGLKEETAGLMATFLLPPSSSSLLLLTLVFVDANGTTSAVVAAAVATSLKGKFDNDQSPPEMARELAA